MACFAKLPSILVLALLGTTMLIALSTATDQEAEVESVLKSKCDKITCVCPEKNRDGSFSCYSNQYRCCPNDTTIGFMCCTGGVEGKYCPAGYKKNTADCTKKGCTTDDAPVCPYKPSGGK